MTTPWSETLQATLARLAADPAIGLSAAEAARLPIMAWM